MEQSVVSSDVLKIIGDVMRRSKYAKTEMCKSSPMSDNPPMLIIGRVSKDGENDSEEYANRLDLSKQYDVAMLPLIHKEDPYDCYMDAISHLPLEPVAFILLIVEGYMQRTDKSALEGIRQGSGEVDGKSLKEDYETNPFSDVREGLVISGVDWEQDKIYMSASTYKYDDHGVPVFDDVEADVIAITEETQEMCEARFTEAMLQTVTYLKLSIKAQAFHNLLTEAPEERN